MFKNILSLILFNLLLFVIWSCGTMAKKDDKISVPQKISVELPKVIQPQKESSSSQKLIKRSKKSFAYEELKDDVNYLNGLRIDIEVNLLFLDAVIDDIDKKCKETALNSICKIPEDTLEILFDEELSLEYKKITNESDTYTIGETLTFGDIEFIKRSSTEKYAYNVKMDTSFASNGTSSQTIEWSKNHHQVLSTYREETDSLSSEIKIDYSKRESGEEQMVVDDGYKSRENSSSDKFHFDLVKEVDRNETYRLSSSSESVDTDLIKTSFTSIGVLSNQGGFLRFKGVVELENFAEYEEFDSGGTIISSSYCYEDFDECSVDDESSWVRE